MALHINTVFSKTIQEEDRFNPKYFRFLSKRNEFVENSSLNFHQLGDPYTTTKVTDGEHQAIDLYNEDEKEAEVRYLYVHNVKQGFIDLIDSSYITSKDHIRLKRSELKRDDVILTIVGTIGKSAMIYDYIGTTNIPRNIAKIKVNVDNILPEFMVAFFLSQFGREQSYYTSGGNIQGLLSLTKMKKMLIPIPKKDVQEEFGNIYLEALEKEKQSLDLLKKARENFYNVLDIDFSKIPKKAFFETDVTNLKNSDLWCPKYRYPYYVAINNAIENKWTVEKLGDIFDFKSGDEIGSSNYHDFIFKKADYIPFIRTSDFINYELDQEPDYFVPKEIYENLNQDIREKDIFFTKDGKVGMCAMATKNDQIIIASGIERLRIKESMKAKYPFLTQEYLFLVLSLKETGLFPALQRTVIASTIPHLREERMKDIKVPIVEKNAINEISSLVEKAFMLKDEKKVLMKKLKYDMDEFLGY